MRPAPSSTKRAPPWPSKNAAGLSSLSSIGDDSEARAVAGEVRGSGEEDGDVESDDGEAEKLRLPKVTNADLASAYKFRESRNSAGGGPSALLLSPGYVSFSFGSFFG